MKTLFGPYSQLLPMANMPLKGAITNDQMQVINNGGIMVADGKVQSIGRFKDLKAEAEQIEEVSEDAVAMPGWIDCHTHMLWGGSRAGDFEKRNNGVSYQQILEAGGGIFDTVHKTQETTDEELMQGLEARLQRHLRDGITTVEIKSGYGLSGPDELRMLRLIKSAGARSKQKIVSTFLGAHVCPLDYNREEYLTYLSYEVFPKLKEEDLTNRVDIFIEKEAFTPELAFDYLKKARDHGFDLTAHANQFSDGGAYLAAKLGARSADHLEHIDDDELSALAHSDTMAVALPGANLGLGAPFTPARRLLDEGAGLAIATDWNPGSAPQGHLLTQASILATHEKLSSAEVFAGVTYRAAAALGLTDRGQLKHNTVADWVCYPTHDYREILYSMGTMQPRETFIAGKKQV